ncbi:hypothetical protein [Tumebacillus permanentifrigoris]|uniref:Uncharacterized protein n=1 Tax=Tumebacillus permanentifrigoris TaxID=378543 RepID=A0A316D5I5_9BACL|nr:hypothetical protein [Tumebacillus permanentifrigoris]PWK08469.1 hypothetical protein C7459_115129 [Tumebacillus permanentifrigoris]
MKILKVEYGDSPVSEWILQKLVHLHEEKYGDHEIELIQVDLHKEDQHGKSA